MKKTLILFACLTAFFAAQAQWTDNDQTNTFIANTSADAGEIYLSTDEVSGDTYVQWTQFASNGWSPSLQRLNFEGKPQWGPDGIHPSYHNLASWSQGIAMVATTDNAVVTCFSTEAGQSVAIKINADGTYAWGEEGITLFDGHGGSRTELLAGDDGGVWALATDITNSYLCYLEADGTANPTITISDSGGKQCTFGLMVPTENGVFLVYEKENWAYTYFYHKEIWVAGFHKDGSPIAPETKLMDSQTIGGSYAHYVVPDGLGGGYAYLWHPAIGDAFNTYVFHFDANGLNTFDNPNGIAVHAEDYANFYLDASATVDPVSHDLIIAYQQTDAQFQAECKIYVNRITTSGEKLWDDGKLVLDNGTTPCFELKVDAFEDGSGFSIVFQKGNEQTGYHTTLEAIGMDIQGKEIWTTQMHSLSSVMTGCENSTGFHAGQNIVAWVDGANGGVYGQNLHPDGTMGIAVTPPSCPGPENFQGEYYYEMEGQVFGVQLTWDEPSNPVEYYRLYRTDLSTGEETVVEFSGEESRFFDNTGIGHFEYQLRALYADMDCGYSEPATTPDGEDHLIIEVTETAENDSDPIVTPMRIYTMNGQLLKDSNPSQLSNGIYIMQGLTQDGRLVTRKIVISSPAVLHP
ncbi:MAG: T9SS type A sorting domain-containing protein [Bacteroidales bacterium]|nr:T9SS type A sorting domain-containing protein [Bacteroidales bacterium]